MVISLLKCVTPRPLVTRMSEQVGDFLFLKNKEQFRALSSTEVSPSMLFDPEKILSMAQEWLCPESFWGKSRVTQTVFHAVT